MLKIVWVQIWVQNCGVLEIKNPGISPGFRGGLTSFYCWLGFTYLSTPGGSLCRSSREAGMTKPRCR